MEKTKRDTAIMEAVEKKFNEYLEKYRDEDTICALGHVKGKVLETIIKIKI